jgi:ubiquinone/menaquinone biosynthesis C-methylase UbiE
MLGNISVALQVMTNPQRLFARLQRTSWYASMLDDWIEALGPQPGCSVLEVGCGPGVFSQRLAKQSLSVTGVDYSHAMIASAKRLASTGLDLSFEQGDAHALGYAQGRFDYVIGASLINVIDSPIRALEEMQRVTAPHGSVSFLVPSTSMNAASAQAFVRERKLRGFASSAMRTWASLAPKMSAEQLASLFARARLPKPTIRTQLGGMVLTATSSRS